MEGRTQAIWFLFLCSCPHSRPVGNTGLGDGGQEDELNWGWRRMLVFSVLQGDCQEESLPDKIRKRKRSQGRRERVITEGCGWPDSFQNVMHKILIELYHFPCGYCLTPCPLSLSLFLHGSSSAMLLGFLRDWSDFYFLSWKKSHTLRGLCPKDTFPWYFPIPTGGPYHRNWSCSGRNIHGGVGCEDTRWRKNRLLSWSDWCFCRKLHCPRLCLGGNHADGVNIHDNPLHFVLNWRIVDLPCRINFYCTAKWLCHTYINIWQSFSYSFPVWFITRYWI